MTYLLFVLFIFTLAFGTLAVGICFLRILGWFRWVLAVPFVLASLLLIFCSILAVRTLLTPELHVSILPGLVQCAEKRDRAGVFVELKKLGLGPKIVEGHMDYTRAEEYGISTFVTDASASRISCNDAFRLRLDTHGFRAENMGIVFLFDSHQQLLTWSYDVDYYP